SPPPHPTPGSPPAGPTPPPRPLERPRTPRPRLRRPKMPELPEMETLRRDLDREVGGKRVKTTEVTGRTAMGGIPKKQLIERLDGVKVSGADRRGLILTLKLDSSELLVL